MEKTSSDEKMQKAVKLAPEQSTSEDWSALLEALGVGRDKKVFALLFHHFAPKVKAYIVRLGVASVTAEELTQEVMLSIWRKAHLYQRRKAAASTWIFALARNQSIDWMRQQKYPQCSLDEWSEEASEPGAGEQSVVTERIAQAMQQLPENQAQVIYMSYFEGRSNGEIASRLDIPLGSVKSRIRLASAKLRDFFGGDDEH